MGTKVNEKTTKGYVYSPVTNGNEKETFEEQIGPAPTIGARHFQCFLYFLLLFIGYGFRVNLSVAIVAMTDPKASVNPSIPTYPEWTNKGAILSAFFWGYIMPQVFAGYAANRFGAKWFIIGTMGIQSIVGFCTPFIAAYFGEKGMMGMRATQGFCQGFLFPSVVHLLSQWVPHEERSRMSSFAFGAVPFGTVIGILASGYISSTWYGWPMVFYIYGSIGILVCIIFGVLGYNSPAVHPTISKEEKYYIEKSLGHTDEKPSHKVPWKAIFTSRPLWALLITQCGFVFGFWVLLSQIPTYMNFVLNFNIKNNSLLSSLPYLVFFILSIMISFVSDFIINKGYLTQNISRKLFNGIGLILPSIPLVMMGYVKSDEATKAVWLLILTIGLSSVTGCGWALNHMDLSPNHAGTLMGICNGVSNIMAILAPLSVQFLVKDERDPAQWRIIFFLAAGIQTGTGLIFNIFGSGDVQPWNEDSYNENEEKKANNV